MKKILLIALAAMFAFAVETRHVYAQAPTPVVDTDSDGIADATDNCKEVSNNNQADGDSDKFGDACDNCKDVANAEQADCDKDGVGNACEKDCDCDTKSAATRTTTANPHVKALQERIVACGCKIAVDGLLGPETIAAMDCCDRISLDQETAEARARAEADARAAADARARAEASARRTPTPPAIPGGDDKSVVHGRADATAVACKHGGKHGNFQLGPGDGMSAAEVVFWHFYVSHQGDKPEVEGFNLDDNLPDNVTLTAGGKVHHTFREILDEARRMRGKLRPPAGF